MFTETATVSCDTSPMLCETGHVMHGSDLVSYGNDLVSCKTSLVLRDSGVDPNRPAAGILGTVHFSRLRAEVIARADAHRARRSCWPTLSVNHFHCGKNLQYTCEVARMDRRRLRAEALRNLDRAVERVALDSDSRYTHANDVLPSR